MKLFVRVMDNPEFIYLINGVLSAETVKVERDMIGDIKTMRVTLSPGVDPQQVINSINHLGRIWPARAWLEKDA